MTLPPRRMIPLALVCSVQFEAKPLLRRLSGTATLDSVTVDGWTGTLANVPVVIVLAGMGKTNAGRALTALLEKQAVRGVIGFGGAGAYPASGLHIGDAALATSEHYGDEGVDTPQGWISCEEIGIPLLERGGRRHFNDFPLDQHCVESVGSALAAAGRPARRGPFVTVSTCSGTSARGERLAARYGALCETMEGAAYAHVASYYDLPFLELRGVSNYTVDRDLSEWRLGDAAEAAAAALPTAVKAWPYGNGPGASAPREQR